MYVMSTAHRSFWQNKGVVYHVNAKTKVAHKTDSYDGHGDICYLKSPAEGITSSHVNIEFPGAEYANRGAVCGDHVMRTVIWFVVSTRWYHTDFRTRVKEKAHV